MDVIDALKWARGGYPVRRKAWLRGEAFKYSEDEGRYVIAGANMTMQLLRTEDLSAEDWEVVK